jgi:hypothetical protein
LVRDLPWQLGLHHQVVLWRLGVLDRPAVMGLIQNGIWFGRAKWAWRPGVQRPGHGHPIALWHLPQQHLHVNQSHN